MGSTLAIAYLSCAAYDLLFKQTMYRARVGLLPGFVWLSIAAANPAIRPVAERVREGLARVLASVE